MAPRLPRCCAAAGWEAKGMAEAGAQMYAATRAVAYSRIASAFTILASSADSKYAAPQ
jgi:hypothetical protein